MTNQKHGKYINFGNVQGWGAVNETWGVVNVSL